VEQSLILAIHGIPKEQIGDLMPIFRSSVIEQADRIAAISRTRLWQGETDMTQTALNLQNVKALALAVTDFERAKQFYTETLSLRPAFEDGKQVGNHLGDAVLLLKADSDAQPSASLNPRITIQTEDAYRTEAVLHQLGVVIVDKVQRYGDASVGSFLDSEGNKLWFCSGPGPS
jgi:catechol 2,3-dioxygenase-like lactoylglutathione lyase family enzyme